MTHDIIHAETPVTPNPMLISPCDATNDIYMMLKGQIHPSLCTALPIGLTRVFPIDKTIKCDAAVKIVG